jgi:NADH:ubiquinone oxidoreductase subunit 6 (subunit J)
MNFKNILYALACLSFSVIIGAAIYEHTALWPAAFSEPPRSLSVFQGPYRLDAASFWMSIHPVTLLLFVIALMVNWKTERRKPLLIAIIGYVVILITTFIYFVPELLELTGTPYSDSVDASLQSRGSRWITLSLIRGGVLIVLAMNLLLGLTKAETRVAGAK